MAAVQCESKDDDSADSSKSPVFSSKIVESIEEHDSTGFPLQSSWTFWLDKTISGTTAEECKANLKKIYTVNTVQSFWAVFNNIPNAAEIQVKYGYHLMRDERYPIWEEPVNQKGGTWRLRCHKSDTVKIWQEVVLAAIGEQFAECVLEGDDVCGVTVSIREKSDVIQIWNINATLAPKATVLQRVHLLLPETNFLSEYYRAHQSHRAYSRYL